jgi:crossover junction endodeoxyribonuclease RuvC
MTTTILGIDPGLANTGFGAIYCEKTSATLSKCGLIKTSPQDHISYRLFQIHTDLNQLIDTVRPSLIAVENIFSLVKYPKAGLMLGGVMAIIYLSAFEHNLRVIEVSTREVKNALVAYGGATKMQVREVTKRLLGIGDLRTFHAADALAVALTVFYRNNWSDDDSISGRSPKKNIRR